MTPPTMRVAVELGFVPGCVECLSVVEVTAHAAFRDMQVTRFVAVPGKKHAHNAPRTPEIATQETESRGGELFAISDTNGSNPEDVERVLANGFDPQGRA